MKAFGGVRGLESGSGGRQEIRDGRFGGRREMGDGRWEVGDGRREMGDGRFDEEMMEEDFSAERSRPFRMWWPRCGDVSDAHEDKSWC